MFLRAVAFAILASLFAFSDARAQGFSYIKASWAPLLQTMIRFGALDVRDSYLLDDYAIVAECPLYERYYDDDFQWQSLREKLEKSLQLRVSSFPVAYYYDVKTQLDRYDFSNNQFTFKKGSSLTGVNLIHLYSVMGTECLGIPKYIPNSFSVVLTSVVNMDGVPLSEKDAHALISLMEVDDNYSRIIYARFKFHIVNIEPFQILPGRGDKHTRFYGQGSKTGREVRFDARLDAIEFYEDSKMSKKITTVKF